jgi:predicted enzyme related to lactoylglutathione lyase
MVVKVKSLKGSLPMEPMDIMDSGRMCVLQDPNGAGLALWEPKTHIGASFKNIPGTLCWNELATHETDNAKAFYTELFGWSEKTENMGDILYTTYMIDEQPVGGMYQMPPEMKNIPSHWLPYFIVNNSDETASKTKESGGDILQPPWDVPDVGRVAVLKDPQGAAFGIVS